MPPDPELPSSVLVPSQRSAPVVTARGCRVATATTAMAVTKPSKLMAYGRRRRGMAGRRRRVTGLRIGYRM